MRSALLILGLLAGCRSIPAKQPDANQPRASEKKGVSEPAADECSAQLRHAEQDYIRGRDLMESAREGEHYRAREMDQALELLRAAAEQGSIRAHSLFGRRMFESLYLNDAPQPAERELYVRAFTSLIIAARRGDEDLAEYMPGLADLRLDDRKLLPSPLPEPLSEIPRDWLVEAVEHADRWQSCGSNIEWV